MSELRVRVVARVAGALTIAAAASALFVTPALAAHHRQTLGSRVLRRGMNGGDVRTLQVDLNRAGIRTARDGVFGPSTARSVKNFERRYRLRVNGVVTSAVVRQLEAVDALDAQTTDAAPGSGGIAIAAGHKVKVKVRTKAATRRAATTADPATVTDPVLAPVKRDGGSAHLGERTLHEGMRGHDVRVLQSYLTLAGFDTTVDGDFGPATKASTVSFQRANNLKPNGVVGYRDSRLLRETVAQAMTSTAAPAQATLNPDGTVTAPAGAPEIVQQVIDAANQIIDTPYIYGGGHGRFNDSGYDCSGAVSYALHGGNLLSSPEDSTQLESYGQSGPGKWITVYADAGHAFVVVAGLAFDTAHYGPTTPGGTGPRWLTPADATANLSDGGHYIVRHPAGL